MAQEEVTEGTLLDAFEKMAYNNGRISVLISQCKEKAKKGTSKQKDLFLRQAKRLEKLSVVLAGMTAELKEKLSFDDLMEVLERISPVDIEAAFDEISKDIKVNIESLTNNMQAIDEILKKES
jgi:hypothetical protein